MDNLDTHKDYNSEPIEYCLNCLSIAIRETNSQPYCDKCGCTVTNYTDILTWEKMYEEMYGEKFLNIKE